MVKQQSGFTLVELIAVLVILGILAATAIPKFIDLSDEAQNAAVASIAGAMESASALNHAVDIAKEAGLTSDTVIPISNCTQAAGLLSSGLDAKYVIGAADIDDKESEECTVSTVATQSGGTTPVASATFVVIGAVDG